MMEIRHTGQPELPIEKLSTQNLRDLYAAKTLRIDNAESETGSSTAAYLREAVRVEKIWEMIPEPERPIWRGTYTAELDEFELPFFEEDTIILRSQHPEYTAIYFASVLNPIDAEQSEAKTTAVQSILSNLTLEPAHLNEEVFAKQFIIETANRLLAIEKIQSTGGAEESLELVKQNFTEALSRMRLSSRFAIAILEDDLNNLVARKVAREVMEKASTYPTNADDVPVMDLQAWQLININRFDLDE